MSKVIAVMGESGSGKTTACRNLNPKETFYIDADRKGLSWKDWKDQYNGEVENYLKTSNVETIKKAFNSVDKNRTHVKYIIVDTLNAIMVDDEMARMKDKG